MKIKDFGKKTNTLGKMEGIKAMEILLLKEILKSKGTTIHYKDIIKISDELIKKYEMDN